MAFEDLYARKKDRTDRRVDVLTEGVPDVRADSALYRLGFRGSFTAGLPERFHVGGVAIYPTFGPIITQRTEMRQRPGVRLVWDKRMIEGVAVGADHWVS